MSKVLRLNTHDALRAFLPTTSAEEVFWILGAHEEHRRAVA